ncbi:MAG: amino acid--tRNA ligase-related protein [Patescibacteria group bacterium]
MNRTLIKDTVKSIGKEVLIKGWVVSRRDHGKIAFLDVRDFSGIIQVVVQVVVVEKSNAGEWDVIEINGLIKERPEKLWNDKMITGKIEIEAKEVKILSKSEVPPIPIDTDGLDINEDLRLKYRYLDLRRDRMRNNLRIRQEFKNLIREFLIKRDFTEISTPILTKSTPEGARDFLVPSRLNKGKFYALPQSPQQYKQLLMVAGVERYFQFPRCFRDEDLRGDRMLEFEQLDIEMSFVAQEEILQMMEELAILITERLGKKVQEKPFPRMTYKEVMEKYNSDKPDIRKDKNDKDMAAYMWVTDFPMFEEREDRSIAAVHHPFTAIKEEQKKLLEEKNLSKEKLLNITAQQYDLVLNGFEIAGGSIREHNKDILAKVFETMGHKKDDIQAQFGHLLEAFKYGVPPHGGIASAVERWLQALLSEVSIREVVAFPTSGKGNTAVMDSPSKVSDKQLKELGIKIDE